MIAITFGRYNLVTNAHVDTLEKMLEKWPEVVIGIVSPVKNTNFLTNPLLKGFYWECDKNNEIKSKYTISERIEMWKETIHYLGISDRVKVVEILRPEYYPKEFNEQFPPTEYHLVFPEAKEEHNQFDIIRSSAFQEILGRDIATVKPSLTLHTSDILKSISDYKELRNFVPEGCFLVLTRLNERNRQL